MVQKSQSQVPAAGQDWWQSGNLHPQTQAEVEHIDQQELIDEWEAISICQQLWSS